MTPIHLLVEAVKNRIAFFLEDIREIWKSEDTAERLVVYARVKIFPPKKYSIIDPTRE